MPNATWKENERKISRILSKISDVPCTRTPLSGKNSKHGTSADVLGLSINGHDIYIEQKRIKRSAVGSLLDKTKEKAKKENKMPIVTQVRHNRPGAIIIMYIDDFVELFKMSKGG